MPQKTVSKTVKRYSVIFGCWDPPSSVIIFDTDRLGAAMATFERLKATEVEAFEVTDTAGGEWNLRVYEHTPESKVVTHEATDEVSGSVFVYNAVYEGSRVLAEFDYMDLLSRAAKAA